MIGKNKKLETSLLDITQNMQLQHHLALRDLAAETMELQSQLDNSIAEKDHASKHLDELEHHVMLWRYKITFEIETQVINFVFNLYKTCFFELCDIYGISFLINIIKYKK